MRIQNKEIISLTCSIWWFDKDQINCSLFCENKQTRQLSLCPSCWLWEVALPFHEGGIFLLSSLRASPPSNQSVGLISSVCLPPEQQPKLIRPHQPQLSVRWRRGCGRGRGEQSEVCWSSCVLAVGGRRLVGIGQVWISLPAGYAVQLRLYIAQAQLRTCITYIQTCKLVLHPGEKQMNWQTFQLVQEISAILEH